MNSTVTLSWFGVFVIFLFGVALGWVFSKLRVGGSLNLTISPGDPLQGASSRTIRFGTTSRRTLALKCQCGALWKFAEGSGPLPAGTQPMPAGDSFVCQKCGKSFDLKAERQLEAEALGKLDFKI